VGGVLVLLPLLRIVRPLVGPAVAPPLYALAALSFADRVRSELAVVPVADQVLLLLEMLAVMAGLAWFIGSGRLGRAPAGERSAPERLRAMRLAAGIALGTCAASFATAAYGNISLARLLGSGLLGSAFMAILLYAALQVTGGLVAFALRVRPLRLLGMVERHRDLLERRAHRLLCWIAGGVWAAETLRHLGLLDSAVALGRAALAAELRWGTIGITLGDVLAFVLTVWLAFLLSALLRFVLEEDVYPRLRLTRGLPYVISSLLHYVILFLGFLLAVAALGVDLNKLTFLTGAFGVGLGFGLRDVVNNFVPGLIVLFERPIHVGDAIQVGDLAGEVRKIGIRASTVRTWEGADVIVPNASLVSEKVTNWTYSDHLRRRARGRGVRQRAREGPRSAERGGGGAPRRAGRAGPPGPLPGVRRERAELRAARVDEPLRPVGRDPKRAGRRRVRGAARRRNGDPLSPARSAPAGGWRRGGRPGGGGHVNRLRRDPVGPDAVRGHGEGGRVGGARRGPAAEMARRGRPRRRARAAGRRRMTRLPRARQLL
jgi:small-conductance mechanosensitive channel